jgi:pimeloyl-ACP methyl ester carboxylesterase
MTQNDLPFEGVKVFDLSQAPMKSKKRSTLLFWGAFALLAGCASTPSHPPEVAPRAAACPEGVPAGARCLRGQDSAKAHYLIVMPPQWSGVLVVHAHGGPSLGEPRASRADADIKRWSITVSQGHAWAGSVFRQGGFAVTAAAEDTDRVRRIFVAHVAKPRRTLLHGQSWGAMVATKAAELFPKSWEGMLLTSGVVAGPSTYDFRLDLRVVYQYLCNNHPRPDETQYPLWMGLPADSKLSNADLTARVNDCLGLNKSAAQRTPEQSRRVRTIVDVVRIPENAIISHLRWGTFTLRDVVSRTGASPFGNEGVRYAGSADDAALNAGVKRYRTDPAAAAKFSADVDYIGRFEMPVLTAHGIGDSTVFVEGSDTLRQRMAAAGNGSCLVQTFVDSREHSYWGDAMYPPLFEALLNWVDRGDKPTPASIAARCRALRVTMPSDCLFVADYAAKPLMSRIPPR